MKAPVILLFATAVATQAQVSWDTDPVTAGAQGATVSGAAWSTTSLFWWNGAGNIAWGAGGDAVFGGQPGTVQVTGGQQVNDLTFSSGTLTPTASAPLSGLYQILGSTTASEPFTLVSSGGDTPTIQVDSGVTALIAASTAGSGLGGAAGFEKTGTGTLILQRNNAGVSHGIDGTLSVTAGRLVFDGFSTSNMGAAEIFPNLDAITVASGATLWIDRPSALGGGGNIPAVTINGGTFTLANGPQALPALTLNAATVNTGTRLTTSSAADEGQAAAIRSTAAGLTVVSQAAAVSSIIGVNMATVEGGFTFDVANGSASPDLEVSGIITFFGGSPTVPMTKNGPGTLELSAANGFQGDFLVNAGLVECGIGNALGAATGAGGAGEGEVRIASGAAIDLNGYSNSRNKSWFIAGNGPGGRGAILNNSDPIGEGSRIVNLTLTGNASIGGSGGYDIGWDPQLSAPGSISGGGFTLTKRGANEVRLRAAPSALTLSVEEGTLTTTVDDGFGSATTSVSAGTTLKGSGNISLANKINSSGNFTLAATGKVNFDGAITAGGNLTLHSAGTDTIQIGGVISGTGRSVVKTGSGDAALAGAQSYTGLTEVQEGLLRGSCSVMGGLSVGKFGTIAPGNRFGVFGIEGDTTVAGVWRTDIDGTNGDRLVTTGKLTLEGNVSLAIESGASFTQSAYVIAQYGTLSGAFASVATLPAGWTVDYAYNGLKQIALVLNPYWAWAAGNGLSGANAQPDADPDRDGAPNGIEFVLGTQPNPANPLADSREALPSVEVDATHVIFTWRRSALAVAAGNPTVQHSTTPGSSWTTAIVGAAGVTQVVDENFHGPGIDKIVTRVPRNGRAVFYFRLRAFIP